MKKLKDNVPPFEITDGPYKGRKYDRTRVYADKDIPRGYGDRFTDVKAAAPKKTDSGRKKS